MWYGVLSTKYHIPHTPYFVFGIAYLVFIANCLVSYALYIERSTEHETPPCEHSLKINDLIVSD